MIVNQFAEKAILNRLVNVKRADDSIVWPNLLVNCTTTSFNKTLPETALSLITNKIGDINCNLENKELKVCSSTFLIANPFHELKYTIDNAEPVTTTNIHFNYQFASSLLTYYIGTDTYLLDDFEPKDQLGPSFFYNELHFKNTSITALIQQLSICTNETAFDEILSKIFYHLLLTQTDSSKKMKSIKSRKRSTQEELYKRISMAKDILFHSYVEPISIEKISKEVCLSKYHFTRLFHTVYGMSPYHFLKIVRLEKSKELLRQNYSIKDVSGKVGFTETNSFSNAFKSYTNVSPTQYRIAISKNE